MPEEPLWYKDAVIYEVHVKSFFDSNNDGVGDIKGLTRKLDYLAELGVTAVWLLPFYPSPLKDDGYDIADYFNIHPSYGKLRDVKEFIREAHKRDLRVITELVLNHTSSEHAWFQRARKAPPGSTFRDFYVWSDTPERYKDTRIIFKDFETSNWTWDPVAKAYYWHRFYYHQPDLNFANPAVEKALKKVVAYWFDIGVDGLRLDAVPYLFEREGTNCENLPETYAFLKKLRAWVDENYRDKMLLAEANQWPEDAAAYFGDGDCCHMAFHFPLMPRMFMASWMEDTYPIIDIIEQTPEIPGSCQWTLFLRNHDELTLEMVTDEERDYMYRVLAKDPAARINLGIRRRLAPLLGNHRRKIELMNVLLFSFPGTPVIYYGDEIGMGDNYYLGDRDGVRTPMQWSADRNAGFSRVNPQKLYLPVIIDPEYHYEALNVENQQGNQASLLWWMKRIISIRKRLKALSRGATRFVNHDNPKVLAFVRCSEDEHILVVANLSRFPQVAELDLSEYAGCIPEEVTSRNLFPQIGELPYVMNLGFYDYYWFRIKKAEPAEAEAAEELPTFTITAPWAEAFRKKVPSAFEDTVLPAYMQNCRWFGGKARKVQWMRVVEGLPLGDGLYWMLFVKVRYTEGESETYLLPLSFASGEAGEMKRQEYPQAVVSNVKGPEGPGVVYDATFDEGFRTALLGFIAAGRKKKSGKLVGVPGPYVKALRKKEGVDLERSRVFKAEQSNTSILYGGELIVKLFRRLYSGPNPDMEISHFLSKTPFTNVPPYGGTLEYQDGTERVIIALANAFVANQGDAWKFAVGSAEGYLERALSRMGEIAEVPSPKGSLVQCAGAEVPPLLRELGGSLHFELMELLGRRTAEMHLALAGDTEDPDFSPEPFSLLYQKSLDQALTSSARKTMRTLGKSLKGLPEGPAEKAKKLLGMEKKVLASFKGLVERKIDTVKIRTHGDYHLGQVLYTGNDFVIIDFEGEPAVPLSERRLKRSALRDVAGMLRSFQYAVYSALLQNHAIRPEDTEALKGAADLWYRYTGCVFLKGYFGAVAKSPVVPEDAGDVEKLLKAFLMEKALYETNYELNNRPDWLEIPLSGIGHLLAGE